MGRRKTWSLLVRPSCKDAGADRQPSGGCRGKSQIPLRFIESMFTIVVLPFLLAPRPSISILNLFPAFSGLNH